MSAGRVPHNPSELLGSHRMQLLLQELSHDHLVVLDAPPLLPVTDAALLAGIADGAIVVFAIGQTYKEQARLAKRRLGQTGGRMLGVVLNRAPLERSGRRGLRLRLRQLHLQLRRGSAVVEARGPQEADASRRPPAEESDAGQGPGRAGGACSSSTSWSSSWATAPTRAPLPPLQRSASAFEVDRVLDRVADR